MAISKKLNAPLLLPALGWISGIILGRYLPLGIWYLPLALPILGAGILFSRLRPYLLIVLFMLLGALRVQLSPQSDSPLQQILETRDVIQQPLSFRVKTAFSSAYNSYGIISDSLAGRPLKARLIFYSERELSPGRRYRGLAELRALQSDPLLDIYPNRYEARAYQKGGLEEQPGYRPSMWVDKLRKSLLDALDAKLGSEAGWAKALLFSDTTVKNEYRLELQQSGVLHLIVVSGLHVWFIYLVMVSLLQVLIPRRWAELIFLPVILLFAALNNWAPSITRSIIMIATLILAHWLQRPLSGAQNISLSLLIITLIQPLQLFSLGLQLSYVSVAVLIFAVPRVSIFGNKGLDRKPWKVAIESILEAITVSALVSIAIAPLTLYHFGTASLNGIIGNLIGIPLSSLLLPLSVMILLIPQANFIGKALQTSYFALIWLWKQWIAGAASLPFSVNGEYFNSYRAIALSTVIVMLLIVVRAKFKLALKLAIPALCLILAMLIIPRGRSHEPEVIVFAAGVADCSLIRLPNGENLMIDTGGTYGSLETEQVPSEQSLLNNNWAERKLVPWLGKNGIRRLDHILITHLHSDHCGGLLSLLKSLEVGEIIIADGIQDHPLWQQLSRSPYFKPEKIIVVRDTCSFSYGTARLKMLHPDKHYASWDENERSLVCRLDLNGQSFLFTGDIGQEAETYLVERYPQELKCNYLKVPHHGSRSSSTMEFIKACQPREAWLCCNKHNRFGFPHAETMQRYRKQQIRLRSTAEGSIRIKNEE